MNFLLMGDPNSIYIKQYVGEVLLKNKHKVYLASTKKINKVFEDYYIDNNVVVVNLFEKKGVFNVKSKIATLMAFIFNLKKLAKSVKFDVIHIHQVNNHNIMQFAYRYIKKSAKKVIVTFWGTDILDIDSKRAKQIKGLMNVADKIVLTTSVMQDVFKSYYGNIYDEKIVSCLFGNPVISHYYEHATNCREFTLELKIPTDKYIISVGYNGATRQQHIKVLEQISTLSQTLKEDIFVLIHMGYGLSDRKYIDKIERYMMENKISGIVFEKYLDLDETIALRKKVDLFIHAQTTDGLSASVLEYIFFGAEILNPKWIPYNEWKRMGISYNEYDNFDELPTYIEALYNKCIKTNHNLNKSIISNIFTWSSVANEWLALYE